MSNNTSSGGVGFFGVLGIVFVVLKLVGVISWSWWWVTAPFWIPMAIFALVVLIAGAVVALRKGR